MLPRRNVSCRYTGGGNGALVKSNLPTYTPAASATTVQTPSTSAIGRRLGCVAAVDVTAVTADPDDPPVSATVEVRDESSDRFNRFRSARISAAVWQRSSRSFSIALLMISSSLTGSTALIRVGGTGARLRMASVMTAEVSPRNGKTPVAIS